jgi:hypothetical protein
MENFSFPCSWLEIDAKVGNFQGKPLRLFAVALPFCRATAV